MHLFNHYRADKAHDTGLMESWNASALASHEWPYASYYKVIRTQLFDFEIAQRVRAAFIRRNYHVAVVEDSALGLRIDFVF